MREYYTQITLPPPYVSWCAQLSLKQRPSWANEIIVITIMGFSFYQLASIRVLFKEISFWANENILTSSYNKH